MATTTKTAKRKTQRPTTRPYVIIRAASAGVFAGELVRSTGPKVTLNNARRIWRWAGAATLSQLALTGPMSPADCKMSAPVNGITIRGVIEVIPCTSMAKTLLEMAPVVWSTT